MYIVHEVSFELSPLAWHLISHVIGAWPNHYFYRALLLADNAALKRGLVTQG